MPKLVIDGREVEFEDGMTVLEVARTAGIEIPTLCFREGCRPETSCLVCVVRINAGRTLRPSCATMAVDGMVVDSETEEIKAARRMALELLLGDHLGDCVGPCQTICPAHMDIPAMIRLISAGRMDEAVAKVKERIPIPAVLGRICPELCEKGCRRKDVDSPVAIRLLKRWVGDYDLAQSVPYRPECRPSSGRRVAIIGAGPTGLSAAYYLARDGHCCVVLDEGQAPGGKLRDGVSRQALPGQVLQGEIDTILQLGIELRPGTRVGRDVALERLCEEFDAVVVATGETHLNEGHLLGMPFEQDRLVVDKVTHMTPTPGLFVASSALKPSRHAVRAVAAGAAVARSASVYLGARADREPERPYTVRMGKLQGDELARFAEGSPAYDRITPSGGEQAGFAPQEAQAEAERCLHCDCAGLADCRLRHWAMRYQASPTRYREGQGQFERITTHPDVIYEPGKCIACGLCVQITQAAGADLGLTFIGRGFDVRVGVPFDEAMSAGLGEVARQCVEACPTGALVMRPGAGEAPKPAGAPSPAPGEADDSSRHNSESRDRLT